MATTITADFPPVAKPEAVSATLTTSWATLIEPANYNALSTTFGGDRTIQPGIAEISSALMLTNRGGTARNASVRITRANGDVSVVLNQMDIEPNDVLLVPLNGQFLLNVSGTTNGTGDKLEVTAEANDAIDATLSYTVGQAESNDAA